MKIKGYSVINNNTLIFRNQSSDKRFDSETHVTIKSSFKQELL